MRIFGFDGAKPPVIRTPLPVGTVIMSMKDDGVTGNGYVWTGKEWLESSRGITLSRADYPELYAVIADHFGPAPEGEFALPDLRDRVMPREE